MARLFSLPAALPLFASLALFASPATTAQTGTSTFSAPPGLEVIAVGTGRTTGHIADVTVFNGAEESARLSLGPFYIPSGDDLQPYVVPDEYHVEVAAGEQVEIALEGYCVDIHRPPVPAGEAMVPVSDWIVVDANDFGPDWTPDPQQGWIPADAEGIDAGQYLVPGTDRPVGHVIDADAHPATIAPILIAGMAEIEEAYDRMQAEGRIDTPMAGDPDRQRESVIQQTLWIWAAGLTGAAYKIDDFRNNTIEQYEAAVDEDFEAVPEEDRERIESGVDQFWNTFAAVGAEAKVLSDADADRDADAAQGAAGDEVGEGADGAADGEEADAEPEPEKCECDSLSFDVEIVEGGRRGPASGRATFTDDKPTRSSTLRFLDDDQVIRIQNPSRNTSDLRLTIDNVNCDCSCGEEGDCPTLYPDEDTAAEGSDAGRINFQVRTLSGGNWKLEGEDDEGKVTTKLERTDSSFEQDYDISLQRGRDPDNHPIKQDFQIEISVVCGGSEVCDPSEPCGRRYRIRLQGVVDGDDEEEEDG